MKMMKVLVLWSAFFALSLHSLHAGSPLLFDGFEAYNHGALDANFPGPNAGPNGGPGNAWWGAIPPDLFVVGAETLTIPGVSTNLVTPHGGTNMVRGANTGFVDLDQVFYNAAFRLNNSNLFSGNVMLDWWFYDPAGAGSSASEYADSLSLAYYPNVPTNTDYPPDNSGPGSPSGQLSLGASPNQTTGFQATNYQALVLGVTNGYGQGWFNLTNTTRSVGWHHARIVLSAALADGSANASFFIDDMTNTALTNNTVSTNGFNIIEMDTEFANLTGYYDDLTFDVVAAAAPVAISITTASGGNVVLTWPGTGWTLQSSPSLATNSFTDIPGATSPYTNSTAVSPQFFRLRQ